MLQDLLLALYGVPGAIFVEVSSRNPDNADFVLTETVLVPISEHIPFVPTAELSLYRELLKLGSCYRTIEKFIRRYAGPNHSLYHSALACGFDDALNDYRKALVNLEFEVLADPDLSIAHFTYRLHSFQFILPVLADIAMKVDRSKPLGCRLLDVVIGGAPLGLSKPRIVIRRLVTRLLKIFYRQLHSWLFLGILHDPHDEFFIQTSESIPELSSEFADSTNFSQSIGENVRDSVRNEERFTLAIDRIPSFLPTSFAHQVLFAGESINLMRGSPDSSLLTDLELSYGARFASLSKELSEDQFITASENDVALSVTSLFELNPLHSLVAEIRSFASHRVWRNLILVNHLLDYLRRVKDIALLGRGELFLAFMDQLTALTTVNQFDGTPRCCNMTSWSFGCNLLDRPVPTDESEIRALEYDVQAAFLAAARSVGLDDEELDSQFSFVLCTSPSDSTGDDTLWDRLHLQLSVPFALRVVFSEQVCRGYDRMFRFLSVIRRTQLALQQYWAEQTLLWRRSRISSSSRTCDSGPVNVRRLITRNVMAFFMENLQYYLQVDVIDSQFSHLINRIQSDEEADLVLVAHEAYIASLQAQALLFHPQAKPCILRLLSVCRQFILATSVTTDTPHSTVPSDLEDRLLHDFHELSFTLFNCLRCSESSGAKSGIGLEFGAKRFDDTPCPKADLSQLLLRLDFNHFYSNFHGDIPVISFQSEQCKQAVNA